MTGGVLFCLGIGGVSVAACYLVAYAVAKTVEAELDELERDYLTYGEWRPDPSVSPFHSEPLTDMEQRNHGA